MPEKKPERGDLVKVNWRDATGVINESETDLEPCVNVGVLQEITKERVILQSGYYKDGMGDKTAIPVGWGDTFKITVLRKNFQEKNPPK
jgi:hypothetical protein